MVTDMTESIRHVGDPESLRAIAHPLRLRLLGHLRIHGPATASELGRRLNESSGSTSYHLRQLQRYGFIEPEPEQKSRREKVWRASHRYTRFELAGSEEERAAVDTIVGVQLEELIRGIRRRQTSNLPELWLTALPASDYILTVSPARLQRLGEEIAALIDAADSAEDPGARRVQMHLQGYLAEGEQP